MAHFGQLVLTLALDHNLLISIGRSPQQHNVQFVMLLGARIGSLGAANGRCLAIFDCAIVCETLIKNVKKTKKTNHPDVSLAPVSWASCSP